VLRGPVRAWYGIAERGEQLQQPLFRRCKLAMLGQLVEPFGCDALEDAVRVHYATLFAGWIVTAGPFAHHASSPLGMSGGELVQPYTVRPYLFECSAFRFVLGTLACSGRAVSQTASLHVAHPATLPRMTGVAPFDVAVVGASIAGCSAARLFGLAGLRVALIERKPDPAAYKVTCTHAILSSAVPTMQRVGIAPLIEAKGALRTHPAAWTPHGGWMRLPTDVPHGYGVTRATLDPLLRRLAAETPGVELISGATAVGLLGEHGRPTGVELETPKHERRAIRARLVVGADGRGSDVARMARVPGRVRPHNRFFYFAYWRGLRPQTTRARLWLDDPNGIASFPNEDDVTVVVVGLPKERLAEFRADPDGLYRATVASVPDAPQLDDAEQVSKLIGKIDMPNVMRPASAPGIAFVGDAALATDPAMGVGCGWAFQSAEWLVDDAAPALHQDSDLDTALERYRRSFRRRLGLHHWLIADLATGRPMRVNERLAFRAASRDEVFARGLEPVMTRRGSPLRLLSPALNLRVVRAGLSRTADPGR
jgi:2-polyprenyl-6-methoxyphenol hydroxylase-like FAD-dependent oxidoreductase